MPGNLNSLSEQLSLGCFSKSTRVEEINDFAIEEGFLKKWFSLEKGQLNQLWAFCRLSLADFSVAFIDSFTGKQVNVTGKAARLLASPPAMPWSSYPQKPACPSQGLQGLQGAVVNPTRSFLRAWSGGMQ